MAFFISVACLFHNEELKKGMRLLTRTSLSTFPSILLPGCRPSITAKLVSPGSLASSRLAAVSGSSTSSRGFFYTSATLAKGRARATNFLRTNPAVASQVRLLGAVSKPVARQTLFASHTSPVSASATFHHLKVDDAQHDHAHAPTSHVKLINWVRAQQSLLEPDNVHWCDGSQEEYDELVAGMVERGVMIPLNDKLRPGSYLTRTDPADVARSESSTFICSRQEVDAG